MPGREIVWDCPNPPRSSAPGSPHLDASRQPGNGLRFEQLSKSSMVLHFAKMLSKTRYRALPGGFKAVARLARSIAR